MAHKESFEEELKRIETEHEFKQIGIIWASDKEPDACMFTLVPDTDVPIEKVIAILQTTIINLENETNHPSIYTGDQKFFFDGESDAVH